VIPRTQNPNKSSAESGRIGIYSTRHPPGWGEAPVVRTAKDDHRMDVRFSEAAADSRGYRAARRLNADQSFRIEAHEPERHVYPSIQDEHYPVSPPGLGRRAPISVGDSGSHRGCLNRQA